MHCIAVHRADCQAMTAVHWLTSIAEVSNVEDGWCGGSIGSRLQDVLQSHT